MFRGDIGIWILDSETMDILVWLQRLSAQRSLLECPGVGPRAELLTSSHERHDSHGMHVLQKPLLNGSARLSVDTRQL